MKVWLGFALLVALFVAGLITGYSYFFRLAYLVAGILALGLGWVWLSSWGLEVVAGRRPQRLRAGMTLEETITVRNHGPLPKVGLQAIERSSLPGHAMARALTLGPGAEAAIPLRTPPLERGSYSLGPTWVVVSDPFSIFQQKRLVRPASNLLVHPRVYHLSALASPRSEMSGESRSPRRMPYLTPKAMGIREYYPGDALKRIHWPLTARWQRLMVKEFEIDPSHNVWLILDLEGLVQRGSGPESTEEYGVSIAASLAQHFLGQDLSLGLVAYGEPTIALAPDRGSRQLMRVMDSLAGVRARGRVALVEAINRQEWSLGRRDLTVVVTPSPREDWVEAAQLLARRGIRLMVVLLEPATFEAGESSLLVFSSLAASRIPTFLVKKGDALDRALSQGSRAR